MNFLKFKLVLLFISLTWIAEVNADRRDNLSCWVESRCLAKLTECTYYERASRRGNAYLIKMEQENMICVSSSGAVTRFKSRGVPGPRWYPENGMKDEYSAMRMCNNQRSILLRGWGLCKN